MSSPGEEEFEDLSRRFVIQLNLNGDRLRRNARLIGFSDTDADILIQLVHRELRQGEFTSLIGAGESIRQQIAIEIERHHEGDIARLARGMALVRDMNNEELGQFLGLGDETMDDYSEEDEEPCCDVNRIRRHGIMEGVEEGWCFTFDSDGLDEYFGPSEQPYGDTDGNDMRLLPGRSLGFKHHGVDLVTALCNHVELAVEIAKHLSPTDIVNLYSVNKAFHNSLKSHMLSSIRQIISHSAPEAGRIFPFKIYRRLLVDDPSGRQWEIGGSNLHRDGQTDRSIPGLRYLQLVLGRDRYCRDILAMFARHGFRFPPGTHEMLLRLWLLTDVSTSNQRKSLMRNTELWTDTDLYNGQMFLLKLAMLFNDPVFGPLEHDIPNLILGSRSALYLLWKVLMRKAFTTPQQVIAAKIRYDFQVPAAILQRLIGRQRLDAHMNVYGVPLRHVGVGHREGWGRGRSHLLRPDELIPLEAVTRGLALEDHLIHMMIWGNFDWDTAQNLVPDEDEMYISDEERTLANVDTSTMWQPRHALKKRWTSLTPAQQEKIREEDEDERLRALAWAAENPTPNPADCDEHQRSVTAPLPPCLDDEINRGCIIRPPEPFRPSPSASSSQEGRQRRMREPPSLTDSLSHWTAFGEEVLSSLPAELDGDERLRAETWNNYIGVGKTAFESLDWDWSAWLRQQRRQQNLGAQPHQGADTPLSNGDEDNHGRDDDDDDGDEDEDDEYEDEDYDDEDADEEEDGEDDDNEETGNSNNAQQASDDANSDIIMRDASPE
ncbi:hypothetical protein CP533_5071 [Ophiocordyceps camponoti-saundersi (nom. inval.)]|nr:hypothetical protein CP533_5071 [Ophiocordyceps camponoti-saundersi (nom. inval.)]